MVPLWKSRKFLLTVLDVVISLIVYFTGRYVAEFYAKDVLFLIGVLQPVFVAIIVAIAVEDAALKRSGLFPKQ